MDLSVVFVKLKFISAKVCQVIKNLKNAKATNRNRVLEAALKSLSMQNIIDKMMESMLG